MKEYLKIKVTSLSAEQAQIRREEAKMAKWARRSRDGRAKAKSAAEAQANLNNIEKKRQGLHGHRVDLRRETRAAHLAYGFVRGRKYEEIERFAWTQPDWNRIQRLVEKYSEVDQQIALQRFAEWKDDALRGVVPLNFDKENPDKRKPGSVKELTAWVISQPGGMERYSDMQKRWVKRGAWNVPARLAESQRRKAERQ